MAVRSLRFCRRGLEDPCFEAHTAHLLRQRDQRKLRHRAIRRELRSGKIFVLLPVGTALRMTTQRSKRSEVGLREADNIASA